MIRFRRKRLITLLLLLLLVISLPSFTLHRKWKNKHDPTNIPYSQQDIFSERDEPFHRGCNDINSYLEDPSYKKMNSTFVMLTRNEELQDVIKTMKSIESHFNQWFQYPYVFLNDIPFTNEFQLEIENLTQSKVYFGTIDELDWEFPKEVRESFEFKNALEDQADRGVMYGSMESYHKMCRFYSGIFYKHPLMKQFEWYWRIEPDVDFFCDITYDPFWEMHQRGKKYGFTIFISELYWTVPNLFRVTKSFINDFGWKVGTLWQLFVWNYNILDVKDYRDNTYDKDELQRWSNDVNDINEHLSENVAIDYLLNDNIDNEEGMKYLISKAQSKIPIFEDKFDEEEFNLCHFWSNFEIARLDVFDNDVYNSYFQYLESYGGFWSERWGDAPIHSLGLGLTLNLEDVHYFRDIGYRHSILQHCPKNYEKEKDENDIPYYEFDSQYKRDKNKMKYDKSSDIGIGCRCQCPKGKEDVEDTSYPCMDIWLELLYDENPERVFKDGSFVQPFNAKEFENGIREDFLQS
ncbi:putative mannosyltransferase NDAI_0B03470 [Naumovozyma dairenensis CBS 421]|uniref:Mannosyltransferase n=1 Tax=Naumovozyma dairenensis (strain ATCC 10597 / BCRC 20456 / CBS 421 / NBRC 0211 / NRRL Y-12639) TaxID=1071378 RepID=G0W6H0_NAUDC|nr:hypothetical protein NDAI_0B03470 [Naumovozyma dairenensis CBS 421]CCD23381.1 hypothetical protein NDAI_0B03470 [Naumovozyma dairenensis CBS 421]